MRTCVGCRRQAEPARLVRIVRAPDGGLAIGAGPGRGAWLCAGSVECFDRAIRRRALGRALRRPVTEPEAAALRAKLFT
ncbi:MAG TPA: YlxR family protein [Acidimicrobiia bacterium]